jgi:hypothetical protein
VTSAGPRNGHFQASTQSQIPFGGMGKPVNQNGFSDHFPITMTVTEVD